MVFFRTGCHDTLKLDHLAILKHRIRIVLTSQCNSLLFAQEQNTALMLAAMNGHKTIVEILVTHGSKIEAKDDVRITSMQGYFEIFFCHYFLPPSPSVAPLMNVCKRSLSWAYTQHHCHAVCIVGIYN